MTELITLILGGAGAFLLLRFFKSDPQQSPEVSKLEGKKEEVSSQIVSEEAKQEGLKKDLEDEKAKDLSPEDLAKFFNNR